MGILHTLFPTVERIAGYILVGVVFGEYTLHDTIKRYEFNNFLTLVKSKNKIHTIYIKI